MARARPVLRPAPTGGPSSAVPLAVVWVALVVYASLFPFEGWRWPAALRLTDLVRLPWPRYIIPFDVVSNLLGYAPLGFLVALARLRRGGSAGAAGAAGLLAGAVLALLMESLQQLLPVRVPSALDWVLNTAGAAAGAALALLVRASGLLRAWDAMRARWLERGQGGALALLLLWPVALLFPAPVLLGLGQAGPPLRDLAAQALEGVAWAQPAAEWLQGLPMPQQPLSPVSDALAVVLGQMAPCLLAFAASRPGLRRLWLVSGALAMGVLATSLSAALNFGPQHAWAWRTPVHDGALLAAAGAAAALAGVGRRLACGLALVVLTAGVLLVHQAPADPYFAQSLQGWEQGRFIRFHGLAQWLGWLWPYAAIAWLLGRLARA